MDGIQESTGPDGTTVVLVTGHGAAQRALAERRTTRVLNLTNLGIPADVQSGLTRQMMFLDPPDHTRLRQLVSATFTAQRIEGMRPHIERIAGELLDAMAGRETVDLLDAYAWPLATRVLCDLIGFPADNAGEFRTWTEIVAAGPDRMPDWPAHLTRLLTIIRDLLAELRAHPGDHLLSELIAARDGEDRLSEDELSSMVFLLLIAGHETAANLIGNGVFRLLEDRSRWHRLRAEPHLLPAAIEEFVRYDPPVAATSNRRAVETFDLTGHTLRPDTQVNISLAQANRDESRFPGADELRLDRDPNPHLGFGHGMHYCLGAPLARLEARVAFTALLQRFPDLRLALPAGELTWRHDFMTGLARLPVTGTR
ncbi:cytochrome P450 family protein [Paractinoplanes hotanensis]|uniref:Cytochrome P450 n=1 Tax=Paractinoplanes hotanensis TaxID=2906497 RepID=A0ABT0YAJ7_9ACTN|nr:cytochrome P450 [Actinoplanes hotanensis]MCM4083062.1 cytochrome P450 [Actinoplanes hotanensis]